MQVTDLKISYEFVEVLGKKLRVQHIHPPQVDPSLPKMIFLHEGLGCIELWKGFPQLVVAATGLQAVVYERQGYGKSDPLDLPRPKDYLEREALNYLPVLLQKLEIKKPILIGHSDGGSIALVYAGQYAVHTLITEAAHIFVEDFTLEGIREVKGNPQLPIIKEKLKKYHGDKTEDIFSAWADTWLREDFVSWDITKLLAGIECPSLIIQGKEDEYATALHVERILEAMPLAKEKQAFMPEGCAHIPHLQAQEVVLEAMVQFIQKQL
jgi:pimeloyl-ACP methyl ester carboxylesterase